MTSSSPLRRLGFVTATALTIAANGCMALTPQLSPTDYEQLERVAERDAREKAYAENAIYRHDLPQGTRYTKGTSQTAEKRSWQSLDAVLRSDAASFAALPQRQLRLARLFTALGLATSLVTVAGIAASAREGLDLKRLDGTGGILLGGGIATVALGITAGIFFTRARKGYDRAVDVYNDSLGVRMGLYTPDGKYIPPRGALVDKDGYILLDEPERAGEEPPTKPVGPEPPPELPASDPPTPSDPPPPDVAPPDVAPTDVAPAEPAPPAETPPAIQRPSSTPGTTALRLNMR